MGEANNEDNDNKSELGGANNNTDAEPTTGKVKDAEPTASEANNDMDAEVDMDRLSGADNNDTDMELTAGGANNDMDMKVDTDGLDVANNIAEKDAKICKSNLF